MHTIKQPRRSRSIACAMLTLLLGAPVFAGSYSVVDLGAFSPTALDDGGNVFGLVVTPTGFELAVVWSADQGLREFVSSDADDLLAGATSSLVLDGNAGSGVVGMARMGANVNEPVAFVHRPQTGTVPLGSLACEDSTSCEGFSAAYGVNAAGVVVGASDARVAAGIENELTVHAFVWTDSDGMTDLGTFEDGIASVANAVNAAGTSVGASSDADGNWKAVAWDGVSSPRRLGALPGEQASSAFAVNDAGVAVGWTHDGDRIAATLWDDTRGAVDLGVLEGCAGSVAHAINASGVVVGAGEECGYTDRAFVWDAEAGLRDLNDLIEPPGRWSLGYAADINRSGEIAGLGWIDLDGDGVATDLRAVLLVPCIDADLDGYAADARCGIQDCDDGDPTVRPGGFETCNARDDNCNGLVDESPAGEDVDADGVHDLCDNCPETFNALQDDADVDRVGDACDNCVLVANRTQGDADFDDQGDRCDLDDGMIYLFFGNSRDVSWQREAGYDSWTFYRGDLGVLRSQQAYVQPPGANPLAGRRSGIRATKFPDLDPLPPGMAVFYLVTGTVDGAEGSLGPNSQGVERSGDSPARALRAVWRRGNLESRGRPVERTD